MKKVVIAIDSMKGCLSSREANEAARLAVVSRWPRAEVVCVPVSDGGEGFLEAVEATGGWERVAVEVLDPLMRPVKAYYLLQSGTAPRGVQAQPRESGREGRRAVVEMAQASGLALLRPEERNPLVASSWGTGQLVADALRRGAKDVTIGLGGSATSDCGRWMLHPDTPSCPHLPNLPLLPGNWATSAQACTITLATDVANPLLGPTGAARVFAPQKCVPGLSAADREAIVEELERRAEAFVAESTALLQHDCSAKPGAGAAGGLGYAFMQYLGAVTCSGAEWLLDKARFGHLLEGADLVITGEGSADRQTLMGKLPSVVLRHALEHNVPTCLLAGKVSDEESLLGAGFSRVVAITPPDMPLAEALRPDVARRNLQQKVASMRTFS